MKKIQEIEKMIKRVQPLVEKMKRKYPKCVNIESLEPALTADIVEIVLAISRKTQTNGYNLGVKNGRDKERKRIAHIFKGIIQRQSNENLAEVKKLLLVTSSNK